ncbi:MAG: esterase-like activity of phytase family protein, partial [Chromatiales bacterium]
SAPRNLHGLYDETGRVWTFPAIDPVDSSLVGLETAPDGSVLILERRYRNVFSPVVIALRRVRLDPARLPHGGAVMPEELARFDNAEGWMLDNFEGIARHRGNHYFLVSDDNNSAMQSTVLLYFEITD